MLYPPWTGITGAKKKTAIPVSATVTMTERFCEGVMVYCRPDYNLLVRVWFRIFLADPVVPRSVPGAMQGILPTVVNLKGKLIKD